MPIAQVLLSNTFNEFRITTNDIISRLNEFEDGTAVVNATSALFSGNVEASYFIGDGSQLTNAGAVITDDNLSSTEKFLLFTDLTSGPAVTVNVDSTQLKYTPSTGNLEIPSVQTDLIIGNTVFQSVSQIEVPVGATADRGTSNTGAFRFNTDISQFEGYNGSAWGAVGGGATGGAGDQVFYENDKTANNTYTITAGKNAMTTGPLTIANGATITVPPGSRFVIL
jgi:hypothetical protein